MKGNSDNDDGGGNDINNNQSVDPGADSTTSPRKKQCLVMPSKPHDEVRDMKGNEKDGGCGDNDNNNQSVETNTSPPRKKQCLVISSSGSKPDNEGSHGSEPDLVGGMIGATSKDVTTQKQGVGETEKQLLDMVQDQMTEETDSDSVSDDICDGVSDAVCDAVSDSGSDYDPDCFSENETVLDHTHEDLWFRYTHLCGNRKVHIICLENRIKSRSECKEYLKKVGCDDDSHFLGGSKGSPHWFYARLTKDEAAKMAREGGVRTVTSNIFLGW